MRIQFQTVIFSAITCTLACGALLLKVQEVSRADGVVFVTESAVRQAAPMRRLVQARLTQLRQSLVLFADQYARQASGVRPQIPSDVEVVALLRPRASGSGWLPVWIDRRPVEKGTRVQAGQEAALAQGFPADRLSDGSIFVARLSNERGDPIFALAFSVSYRSVSEPGTSGRGVLVGLMSQSPLAAIAEETAVADGSAFVFNDKGYVVSHTRPDQVGMQFANADSEPIVQKALSGVGARQSWVAEDDDGANSLQYFEAIDKTNLQLGIKLPMALAQSATQRVLRAGLIVSLLVLIMSMSLAWFFGQLIASPLSQLSRALQILQQGSIEARIPVSTRRDEIGELSRALAEIPPAVLAGRPELMAIGSNRRTESGAEPSVASEDRSVLRSFPTDSAVLDRLTIERASALQQFTDGLRKALREPIATILAQIHLVQLKIQGQPAEGDLANARDHASIIEREARRARESLEKISGLGLEHTAIDFDKRVATSALLNSVCERWDETLSIDGIKIKRDVPDSPCVRGSEEQIGEAVSQLISNARLAVRGRAKRDIQIRLENLNDHAYISVSDTGIGMSRDVIRRSTEPFYQEFAGHDGLGLGLTFVRSVAERHGGSLSIEATAGEGSTATIKLPVRSEDKREFQASAVNLLASRVGQTFRRAQAAAPAPSSPIAPNLEGKAPPEPDSTVNSSALFEMREMDSEGAKSPPQKLATQSFPKEPEASAPMETKAAVRDMNVVIRKPKRKGGST